MTISGRLTLPCSSRLEGCTKYSWSLRSPESSRIRSSTSSPQLPWILLSPFKALVRFSASSLIRLLADCKFCISLRSEARSLVSLRYTSSTRLRKSPICSRKGLSITSSDCRCWAPWALSTFVASDSNSTFMRSLDSRSSFSRAVKLAWASSMRPCRDANSLFLTDRSACS